MKLLKRENRDLLCPISCYRWCWQRKVTRPCEQRFQKQKLSTKEFNIKIKMFQVGGEVSGTGPVPSA